jgi:hypothetical protein
MSKGLRDETSGAKYEHESSRTRLDRVEDDKAKVLALVAQKSFTDTRVGAQATSGPSAVRLLFRV